MSIGPTVAPVIPDIPLTTATENLTENTSSPAAAAGSTESTDTLGNQSEQVSFSDVLMDFLPNEPGQEVNEEQLFSAVIAERLEGMKGSEALDSYKASFEEHLSAMKHPNGYEPVEDASRAALNDMVDQGILSLEEAESIHAQAFQAAQLDDNQSALYDSLGSTTAVAMIEMALESSTNLLAAFDSGEKDAGRMSLDYRQDSGIDYTSASSSLDTGQSTTTAIGGGFLFKPVSESDGNLVVLLPSSMSGDVSELTIRDSNGQVLDTGRDLGDYDDGRPLFRFSSPGGAYPENITVTALMSNGEVRDYTIPAPAQRYE